MNRVENDTKFKAAIVIPWIVVLALGIFMTFFQIGADALWYDESFSAAVAKHSAAEIVPMIAKDSHPPLYYLMLRGTAILFGNSETALRSLSALGILALAALGFFPLRKLWGNGAGLAFALVALVTPMSIVSAHEVRMYSWAAFFVTAMVIQSSIIRSDGRVRNWVILSFLTLCAAYTHYYALIASGFCWLILLATVIRQGDRKNVKRALISALAIIVLYMPWFIFLFRQASRVAKSFWIGPVTVQSVIGTVIYPFMQKFSGFGAPRSFFIFIAVLALSIAGIVRALRKKDGSAYLAATAISVYALTLVCAIAFSLTVKPILVERYMVTCMGLLLLAFVAFWASFKNPVPLFAMVAAFALANAPTLIKVYTDCMNGPMDVVAFALKDKVKRTDIFIHGSEHNFGTFSYYFPNNRHFLYVPEGFIPNGNYAVFAPNGSYGPDYMSLLDEPVTVWATNRAGEQYAIPIRDLANARYRKSVGQIARYKKEPGWYTVMVQEIAYDPAKAESSVNSVQTGTLKITVTGIDPSLGGGIGCGIFNADPISNETVIAGGGTSADAETVTFEIEDVPYGPCAAMVFHDVNDNSVPDFRNGKPVEGVGVKFEPEANFSVSFDDLKFEFSPDKNEREIKIFYPK